MVRLVVLVAAGCVLASAPARGQTVLTFEEALARARAHAGAALVGGARVAEAEAVLVEASARFRDNPVIEASAGPRTAGETGRSTDLDVGVSQRFETGGQRAARISAARAGIDRERALADAAIRAAMFETAMAFLDGVAAGERLRIAEEADTVGRELLAATERRYALGDIAAIDLNLARIDAARSAAALQEARAGLTRAAGAARALLRLPPGEPIEFRGTLDPLPPPPPLAVIRAALQQRPDFAALDAEARAADAQVVLGRALRRPDVGVRVGYAREETRTIVLGGLTVTLPSFQRGRGTLAAGVAQAGRARLELEILRQRTALELDAAYAVHEQQAALAARFAGDVGASVGDNETLARRSYDAGELGLRDYLLIRRDALETRTAVVARQLEAARSRVAIDYVAGVLR
jgi:cobalt-zinc-cadmium efflux system outer membrane protein